MVFRCRRIYFLLSSLSLCPVSYFQRPRDRHAGRAAKSESNGWQSGPALAIVVRASVNEQNCRLGSWSRSFLLTNADVSRGCALECSCASVSWLPRVTGGPLTMITFVARLDDRDILKLAGVWMIAPTDSVCRVCPPHVSTSLASALVHHVSASVTV